MERGGKEEHVRKLQELGRGVYYMSEPVQEHLQLLVAMACPWKLHLHLFPLKS